MGAIAAQWNVALFIFGLMGISGVAEESGAFALVAKHALRLGDGSVRRLFVVLFLAGAVLTMLLSNDATAIVFTPIVYRAVKSRVADVMPFLFGCSFAANTASFGLPFANPANILVIPRPYVLEYLAHLGLPQVAAIAINLVLFLVVFRGRLDGRYDGIAEEEARHPAAARTLLAACLIAAAYVVAMLLRAPLGPVALLGAVAMMCVARVPVRRVLPHIGGSIFIVLAALFVLVDVLGRAGFFGWALRGLDDAMRYGPLAGVAAATLGTAALAALLNNLPVAVGAQFVAAQASWPHVAYGLIAGVDLGPNLLTTASLSTILWLSALRRRGVRVNAFEYARLGILVVPPMLGATIAWLWVVR